MTDAMEEKVLAVRTPELLGDSALRPSRKIRLAQVIVLAVAGLAITFSATMHEQLSFDRVVVVSTLAAIAVMHAVSWLLAGTPKRNPVSALLAIVAILAAVSIAMNDSVTAFAVLISVWALVSALLEFFSAALNPALRGDATFMGATGVLLALLVLLVRTDPVAVLGFFGGYAIITAVFLGISVFDSRDSTTHSAATPLEQP